MQCFLPDLRLATQLPPQSAAQDKLGGLPWGLPVERWPVCAECGGHQSLLAQFLHDDERLDLGKKGRVLFVFQCNHDPGGCESWGADSGANACLILNAEELSNTLTECPAKNIVIETEARAVSWLTRQDKVADADFQNFFADPTYAKVDKDTVFSILAVTRLGSVPSWVQSADESPKPPWRFVGQLDSAYRFYSPVPPPDEVGCQVGKKIKGKFEYANPKQKHPTAPAWVFISEEEDVGTKWTCPGPNFGDTGIGYIFVRTTDGGKPEGKFFWQCG
jgi:hypothetical protein